MYYDGLDGNGSDNQKLVMRMFMMVIWIVFYFSVSSPARTRYHQQLIPTNPAGGCCFKRLNDLPFHFVGFGRLYGFYTTEAKRIPLLLSSLPDCAKLSSESTIPRCKDETRLD